MSSKNMRFFVAVLFVFVFIGCDSKQEQVRSATVYRVASKPIVTKKVLVIHSYYHDYEWVNAIDRGIRIALSDSLVEIEDYYMDTKRNTSDEWKESAGREALDLVEEWRPDVVIAIDDNAQKLVGSRLVGADDVNVVFCGVNADAEDYGYPAHNVTGVLERPHLEETCELFLEIFPKSKKILFMSDVGATTDGVYSYMQKCNLRGLEVLDWLKISTFKGWKDAILKYQDQIDGIFVYTYHTIKGESENNNSMSPKDVMEWTVENCKKPLVGFFSFSIDNGLFCGVMESGVTQGKIAGEMAVEILGGKSPHDISIEIPRKGQLFVNLGYAQKYNIDVSNEIINRSSVVVE